MGEDDNLGVVKAYLAAVERFDVEAMVGCLAPEMLFVEMPNLINPAGSRRDLTVMKEGLPKGRQILQRQSYGLGEIIAAGDRLVVEARWEGVLAIALGALKPGDTMVAHICMIFRFKDGLIVEQRNYDCYDRF